MILKFFSIKVFFIQKNIACLEIISPNGKLFYKTFFNIDSIHEFGISIDDLNRENNFTEQ